MVGWERVGMGDNEEWERTVEAGIGRVGWEGGGAMG